MRALRLLSAFSATALLALAGCGEGSDELAPIIQQVPSEAEAEQQADTEITPRNAEHALGELRQSLEKDLAETER